MLDVCLCMCCFAVLGAEKYAWISVPISVYWNDRPSVGSYSIYIWSNGRRAGALMNSFNIPPCKAMLMLPVNTAWYRSLRTSGKDLTLVLIHAFRYVIILVVVQQFCQDKMFQGAHPSCLMTTQLSSLFADSGPFFRTPYFILQKPHRMQFFNSFHSPKMQSF